MIKIIKESSNSELIKRAQRALNYRLGRGEEYATVDDAEIIGKTDSGDLVRVTYSVRVHIPVWTDPETGITEYEDDYEYRTDDIVI